MSTAFSTIFHNISPFFCIEQKDEAIELYKKGIRELELGLALECSINEQGDSWHRVQQINDKMKTNLQMAKDRLLFLGIFRNFDSQKTNFFFNSKIFLIVFSTR